MKQVEFKHTNECNVTRALEVFMVARKINSMVTLKIINMPSSGNYGMMYKLVRCNRSSLLMQGAVEFQMSNVLKSPCIESVNESYDRAMGYRERPEIFTMDKVVALAEGMSQACKNLLKVAVERLGFKADTVSAIYVVASAIAFMDGSMNELRPEHLAEAIQYYCEISDPVTKAFEILEKVKGKSSADNKLIKEARLLLLDRITD